MSRSAGGSEQRRVETRVITRRVFILTRVKSKYISPNLGKYLLRIIVSSLKNCPYVLAYSRSKLRLLDVDNKFYYVEVAIQNREFVLRYVKDIPVDLKSIVDQIKRLLIQLASARGLLLLKIGKSGKSKLEVCVENVPRELTPMLMERLKFQRKENSRNLCKLYSGVCMESLAFQDVVHLCQLAKLRGFVVLYVDHEFVVKVERMEDVWDILLSRVSGRTTRL